MRTHAVFLRLEGRRCVVVGGNAEAEAKARACRTAGAEVAVVARDVTAGMATLARDGEVEIRRRDYEPGDLAGVFLAYASTDDPRTIARLRAEADREHVLLNVMDVPDACSFFSPAVVARGDLQVAIGTGGASPGLASRIRGDLERQLGPEYEPYVAILGAVRRRLEGVPERGAVMTRLVESDLLALVRARQADAVDRLLAGLAGAECTLARLGVRLGGEG
jgi:siroheme synthase-like protein